MKKTTLYVIKITNFVKHNPTHKKGFKHALIAHNFCDDPAIQSLPLCVAWLFLNLVLTCADTSQEASRGTVRVTPRTLQGMIRGKVRGHQGLDQLQSLQLLTYEKIEILLEGKGREEKVKEEKGKEKKKEDLAAGSVTPAVALAGNGSFFPEEDPRPKNDPVANKKTWEAYKTAFFHRHRHEPLKNQKNNALISNFVKRVGPEDAPHIIRFYVSHNDATYMKSMHSLGFALRDAESLRGQWITNNPITGGDMRRFEKTEQVMSQLDRINSGQI